MRILIADDDPVSRKLLESTLTRLGHEVVAVSDGVQAQTVLLGSDSPRMAILDWMMPGADGITVCRELRRQTGHYVYVILLTARGGREDLLAGLEAEADEFLIKPVDVVELRARLRSGERVLALQEGLLQAQDALRVEATHDRLTGLLNRGAILDHLEVERRRMSREQRPLALALMDVDHFKPINDTHGHLVGDLVLRETAMALKQGMRGHEVVGRYGGEEFLAILPGASESSAFSAIERLRGVISASPIVTAGGPISVTISAGLAWVPRADRDATGLVHAADLALYRAKAAGRNCVRVAPVSAAHGSVVGHG